jgi:DNA polymerase-3 subunit beta
MKFTCLRENLLKGLNAASKVVPIKNTLPILSHVLIKAETGKISIIATNLESALTVSVPASVDAEGTAAVSLKLLRESLSHMSSSSVIVEYDDDKLNLSSAKSKSTFMCLPASDFPSIPTYEEAGAFIETNSSDLLNAVSQVVFSAASDEARPVYTGLKLFIKDGDLFLATTDGFRLSEKRLKLNTPAQDSLEAIVPAKTLMEIVRILSASNEPVRIFMNPSKNLLFLENDEVFVATGVIDGNFPDYTKIIPTDTLHSAEILLKDLLEAVKLSSVFAKEDSDALKLVFDPEGFLHVKATSQETGESLSKVEASVESAHAEGDASGLMEVAFNPRYLLDIFNNLKSDKIVIKTATNTSPCLIKTTDSDSYIHIVMPVRLNN